MFKSYYDGSNILNEDDHLEHWGILGMHWGVRRFQNKDGSLTTAGRARYGTGKRKLSKEAQKRAKMRSEAADMKARAQLNEAKKQLEKSMKKPPKLSKEAKKRAKERARVSNMEKDAELKQREAAAIKAKEDAARAASDSRRMAAVAKENEKTMTAQAKANRIQAEEAARIAKREAKDAAHRESWTPFHTKSGKNRAISSGDPDKINKYASRMTPQELRQALDAYRVKEATGKVRVKKSILDKATFKTYRGKDKAVLSGDPKQVKKYSHLMTSDEYRRAIERCNAANELKLQNLKKISAYGETLAKGIGSVANVASSAVSLHDTMATIHNATTKSGKTWKKWGSNESDSKWKSTEREMTRMKFLAEYGYDPVTNKSVWDFDKDSKERKIFLAKHNKKGNSKDEVFEWFKEWSE